MERRERGRGLARWGLALVAVIAAATGSCSSASGGGGTGGFGNQGGVGNAGNAGGTAGGGGVAAGGGGGVPPSGGSGGSILLDAGGGGGGVEPDAQCSSVGQVAKPTLKPADIIWAVDTSGSMVEEAAAVQQNLNGFAQQIVASGIDVHVIMLATCPFWILPGISVAPPLGTGQPCPNDTNLPGYFHQALPGVQSTDGMKVLYNQFPNYRPHLRANSLKYVVIVTDDEAGDFPPGVTGANFVQQFTALDPILQGASGQPAWSMSGVYAFTMCANAANVGTTWANAIQQTGGVATDICGCTTPQGCATQFQQITNQLATKIVEGAQALDCEWTIPVPPAGQQLDPGKVNVELIDTTNGIQTKFYKVSDAASCDPVLGGWYYDDNTTPTRVIACPQSCTQIKAVATGNVNVLFGCATETIPE
ncbi:MAG: hypothetical protein IT376_11350 [Polyangiaceae bacterium]|nr:hypothetical protein [Polyangiaceae bacterium]